MINDYTKKKEKYLTLAEKKFLVWVFQTTWHFLIFIKAVSLNSHNQMEVSGENIYNFTLEHMGLFPPETDLYTTSCHLIKKGSKKQSLRG